MLSVTLAGLRARWVTFLGAFVALVPAVALLVVMGQAVAASLQAPERVPERFAAAPVVVRAQDTLRVPTPTGVRTSGLATPRPLSAETLTALRASGRVTEDRAFPVRVDGGPGDLVGHPWPTARFAPYRLNEGRPPQSSHEVVVTGNWSSPGAQLRTLQGTFEVVGLAGDLGFERAVFFTAAQAAALAPRTVQAVVEADPSAVRDALARTDVRILTGADRADADAVPDRQAEELTALNALFGTAGGVTAFVSVFVVASTFAFTVAGRRREFGLLRMAGATAGQVRRTVLTEALLIGVLASAAGCALGAYAAPYAADLVVDAGLAPAWFTVGGRAWPYHAAFWTGVTVAVGGAVAASWRAGRTAPSQALREASVDAGTLPLGRRVCGAALLLTAVATLAYSLLADPGDLLHRKTYVSRPMLLITAVALLSPALIRPLVRLVSWPATRLRGAVGLLARENASASLRRTASLAAPVLVTVALSGSLLGAPATLAEARAREARQQTTADFVVRPSDPASAARLKDVPGADVSASAPTVLHTLEDGVALVKSEARAVDPTLLSATARLPVVSGRLADLDDGSIVVTEEWARHRAGEKVRVWLADGTPRTLRIAAVLAVGTGANGAYVTPANAPGAVVDRVDVRVRAGADRAAVESALRAVDGARTFTGEQWVRAARPAANRAARVGVFLVLGIAVLYTTIALVNTLLMAASDRGRELASLRLTGATRAQLLRLTALEALVVVIAGAVLGLLVTLVDLSGMSAALRLLSAPPVLSPPWAALGAVTAVCALLAVLASAAALAARAGRKA
ncbi:ABC transporter permease [Streptomyces roseirectus]|uniref:ABC transporter permease n=1 Tax=Streptomyces roseirectus TaxID=2768066 RepID=A0A7H0IH92_9ACTN|nr:FtsX family ABC transporter permease [Streptomyces roseirectus]QNP72158.1 ABC transporter permease [Streptomyces roseirectus]